MPSPPVLYVAKRNFGSLRIQHEEALVWLRRHFDVRLAHDEQDALRTIEHLEEPLRAIIVAQTQRRQFSQRFLESLHAAAPLARLINLLGGWCEGEQRSGQPLDGVIRIYEHQWQTRFPQLLRSDPRTVLAGWNGPRSLSTNEIILQETARPLVPVTGLLGIVTPRVVDYEALAALAVRGGFSSVWIPAGSAPKLRRVSAILWDEPGHTDERKRQLELLRREFPDVPLAALASFPRRHEIQSLRDAGVDSVISKPFLIHDLWNELLRIVPPASFEAEPRSAPSAA